MYRIRRQQAVDLVRAYDLGRNSGLDIFFREPPRGILGEQQLPEPALRILQRHGDGVPAIQDGRPIMVAILPDRPSRAGPALVEGLAAPPLKSTLPIAIAHGRLVSWVPGIGNLT